MLDRFISIPIVHYVCQIYLTSDLPVTIWLTRGKPLLREAIKTLFVNYLPSFTCKLYFSQDEIEKPFIHFLLYFESPSIFCHLFYFILNKSCAVFLNWIHCIGIIRNVERLLRIVVYFLLIKSAFYYLGNTLISTILI